MEDIRIVVALCAILQAYLQTQPALARESAWVLNNLTGFSLMLLPVVLSLATVFCGSLIYVFTHILILPRFINKV